MNVNVPSATQFSVFSGVVSLSICMIGCGQPALTTIPVEGKVTWNGQPVPNGDIAFHPTQLVEGGVNRIGIGRLDAQGNYKISTVTHGDGLQPGEYSVVISSRGDGKPRLDPEGNAQSNIPVIYGRIATTPLKATIAANASGPVKVDFPLKE
jgi:hypothetical protein